MDHQSISQILESWNFTPRETDSGYFRVWQRVAVELQKALRAWIPEVYFENLQRFEKRMDAYSIIVYAASRPCYGRPRIEFTYDLAEAGMPEAAALRSIGSQVRKVLSPLEARLREAGRPDLAMRYLPVWHEDIVRAVRRRPRLLLDLLASDARLVNAVIHLGATRNVGPFQRAATLALRSVGGVDMRTLAVRALELTSVLINSRSAAPAA